MIKVDGAVADSTSPYANDSRKRILFVRCHDIILL